MRQSSSDKMRYENFHASGHAPTEDLKKVMEGSDAKTKIPISLSISTTKKCIP